MNRVLLTVFFKCCANSWLYFLLVVLLGHVALECVEIRRLLVPRWVQNGTEEFVVLDCDYVYNENDLQLVVKWFFEDSPEPAYQWIPELNSRHTSGVLEGKLDLSFSVNSADSYSKYRALKIRTPSVELSGKYTCLVTSLAGQDSREQNMTVFVPANYFEVTFAESQQYDLINVSCEGRGLFPSPVLRLFSYQVGSNIAKSVHDVHFSVQHRSSGGYNVHLYRIFTAQELATQGDVNLECVLELPGTNYVRKKRIGYYHGIQGHRLGDSRDTALSNHQLSLTRFLIFCVCLHLIGQH